MLYIFVSDFHAANFTTANCGQLMVIEWNRHVLRRSKVFATQIWGDLRWPSGKLAMPSPAFSTFSSFSTFSFSTFTTGSSTSCTAFSWPDAIPLEDNYCVMVKTWDVGCGHPAIMRDSVWRVNQPLLIGSITIAFYGKLTNVLTMAQTAVPIRCLFGLPRCGHGAPQ